MVDLTSQVPVQIIQQLTMSYRKFQSTGSVVKKLINPYRRTRGGGVVDEAPPPGFRSVFTYRVIKPENRNHSINKVTNRDMIDDKYINNFAKN